MSDIIEGYNYDVFISNRQKDNQPTASYGWQNKGDRWVSEFVEYPVSATRKDASDRTGLEASDGSAGIQKKNTRLF
jgi:hypothetical protein